MYQRYNWTKNQLIFEVATGSLIHIESKFPGEMMAYAESSRQLNPCLYI